MKKIQINKIFIYSMIFSSLIISSIAVQQTIASNNNLVKNTYSIAKLTSNNIYSNEVELNSAGEYSINVLNLKEKYKKIFKKKLDKRLNNLQPYKLKLIIKKIDYLIENVKQNENISLEKQERILAQLLALKELINDLLLDITELSIDIDIEKILKI